MEPEDSSLEGGTLSLEVGVDPDVDLSGTVRGLSFICATLDADSDAEPDADLSDTVSGLSFICVTLGVFPLVDVDGTTVGSLIASSGFTANSGFMLKSYL